MKSIVALVTLICSLGVAAAQIQTMGEGYSTSQLAFLNSPSTSTFEPSVSKYWESYISGGQNVTPAKSRSLADIEIWMNTFPLNFNTPIQVKSSSFEFNVTAPSGLGAAEMNSMILTRDINAKFDLDQSSKYKATGSSLSFSKSSSSPTKGSNGEVISQGIISLFST